MRDLLWRHAPVLAFLAAIVATAAIAFPSGADQIPDPGYAVTVTSPTTNLVDGQRVVVNVKSNSNVVVGSVEVRECRLGATYTQRSDMLPPGGKCSEQPVSTTGDLAVARGLGSNVTPAIQSPAGATLSFKVGVGTTTWTASNGEATLTCDQDHPCALVVQLLLISGFVYVTSPLTFLPSDPLAGCGGVNTSAVASAASDQMSDAWAGWTQAICKQAGANGAPTRASFPGEGAAVQLFASGAIDLAYTASGYDSDVGLGPTDPTQQRAAVTTPVALNAAVIAVGGGFLQPITGDKAPYPTLKMTAAEVSGLFGGGIAWVNKPELPYQAGILNANPVLNGHLFATVPPAKPMAPSEAESSSWFMTNYLTKMSPKDWVVPFTDPLGARGASASLATASPGFQGILDLFSGRPALNKVVDIANNWQSSDGPIWALTDLATAEALGMTPVSIQNADGAFVAPTASSMAAAVATMKPDDQGLLLPNPSATATSTGEAHASDAVEPYPLTYVEYAMTPAEPLVDATNCTARSDSQAQLAKWLGYLVGDGQQALPAGLQPLPASLLQTAKTSVERVGAAPVTGACAGSVSAPSGTGTVGSGGGGGATAPSGFASSALPSSSSPSFGSPTGLATGTPNAASTAAGASEPKVKLAAIPAFAGHQLPGSDDGVVALLGIVLLTSLAAWITAGTGVGVTPALAGAGGGSTSTRRRNPTSIVALWVAVAIAGMGLVVFQLGPFLQQRSQRQLLSEYRVSLRHAANELKGLPGAQSQLTAPDSGSAVGIVEIGALHAQEVAIEGVSSDETEKGPGHVPGTAGLGQPGNAVLVARRNGFGGPFGDLASLKPGARILVTTTQGQTVYAVRTVVQRSITGDASNSASSSSLYSSSAQKPGSASGTISTDRVYGPSKDDRLTLVTSANRAPWNSSDATIVTARLLGRPYPPTPQGGRTDADTGRTGTSDAWPAVLLAFLAYGAVIVASVLVYRRLRFRVAYVLTIAPLVAITIIVGVSVSRILPAWM